MTTKKKSGRARPKKKSAKKTKKAVAKRSSAKKAVAKAAKKSAKKSAARSRKVTTKPKPKAKAKAASKSSPASVEKGARAPDFTLASDQGGQVTLSALRGKKVVLYFYPKDDTPGCTVQACDFRDSQPTFAGLDAVVLGVSADSVASHEKFRDKFGLNFPLLADEDHAVASAYGVWKEKSMYGRTFMGIERSTFLIDEDGWVVEAWRKVTPQGHAEMLAEVLAGL
jgi:peroxiredoxin Q/BCP